MEVVQALCLLYRDLSRVSVVFLCCSPTYCLKSLTEPKAVMHWLSSCQDLPVFPHDANIIGIDSFAQFVLCESWRFELRSWYLHRKHSYPLSHLPSSRRKPGLKARFLFLTLKVLEERKMEKEI